MWLRTHSLAEIANNRMLLAGIIGWLTAQLSKLILDAIQNKKLRFSRLFGLGGMPSSHTSTVVALTMSVGKWMGFAGAEFAISLILTTIVITDATGVRRAAGNQAKVINQILEELIDEGKGVNQQKLKELLGHTPAQVLVGAIIGIVVGLLV